MVNSQIQTENSQQQILIGKIQAIFFENSDNFYKVLQVKLLEADFTWPEEEIVVTGNFANLSEGEKYRFFGHLFEHPRYGKQFQAENYQTELPTQTTEIVNYLAGENFPGIGQKTAERIVKVFGTATLTKLQQDPASLSQLGLSKKQRQTLIDNLTNTGDQQQAVIELNRFGFGSQLTARIYEHFQKETLAVLHHQPYRLAFEINGIGFKRADRIAEQQQIAADDPQRLQAALYQSVYDLCHNTGDTYTSAPSVMQQAMDLLLRSRRVTLSEKQVADQLVTLAADGKIVVEKRRIYLRHYYEAEWKIAEQIKTLLQRPVKLPAKKAQAIDKLLTEIALQLKITYGAEQLQAIKTALKNRLLLITGGPGTGKTTIINGIVALFAAVHDLSLDANDYQTDEFPIVLAAPTGRAAKKMSETTGLPAVTIHRLLGLNGSDDQDNYQANENLTLAGQLLIVDEMSMVDTSLFERLLAAVPTSMQLILVGDQDQLPSVGPGQVFADLLACEKLPQIRLEKIYRQKQSSTIISLAHAIKKGILPADFTKNQFDRSFIACSEHQVESAISQIILYAQKKKLNLNDVQVLAPMYRGQAGIDHLNVILQNLVNPKGTKTKELVANQQSFRIGDKVLHLVNSPENNVFNGDIGQIVGINLAQDNPQKPDQVIIDFDGNEVTYLRKDLTKIKLAYCVSIHKAQGSEFKLVILPLVNMFHRMLNRNLLYTAITRAKKMLILLGQKEAFQTAVDHVSVNRKTSLLERLSQALRVKQSQQSISLSQSSINHGQTSINEETTKYILTSQLIANEEIDPLIGMNGLKPIDFKHKN